MVQVSSDCYMHTPRGSNNRLNEKSANRNNGNRMFDSQNNNRGGYNVGDLDNAAFAEGDTGNVATNPFTKGIDKGQYSMMFFEGSHFTVEWTNQHGCGGKEGTDPNKLNCNLVLQFACNTDVTKTDLPKQLHLDLKAGRNTNTPDTTNTNNPTAWAAQATTNDNNGRGRHENEGWYYQCTKMQRNKGLFLADQNVKGNSAQYTRQNPNGNRRGLECPEERDYYPYWNPSQWMDIAMLTDNVEDCTKRFDIKGKSQNNNNVCACYEDVGTAGNTEMCYNYVHNETKCVAETGCKWYCFNHGIPAPRCEQAPWTRANSLGNGRDGQPTRVNITFPMLVANQIGKYTDIKTNAGGQKMAKCVMRIRYNISTDDYDVAKVDYKLNYNRNAKPEPIVSPVTQNPTVDIGLASLQGLRLAINTNQFGRTFQDRTHTWYLMSKTGANAALANKEIYNVIVRGKRGNIVQTFPAVEYDFAPKIQTVKLATDLVHVQWTGSNTHNNGNPAGDGQAGDAGEGTTGTDRHNIVPINQIDNYILPFGATKAAYKTKFAKANLYEHFDCWEPTTDPVTGEGAAANMNYASNTFTKITEAGKCALKMSSSGYYQNFNELKDTSKAKLSVLLNNAPASFAKGMILQPKTAGEYAFMCSRNNNFSNRSQKGSFIVE